MEKIFVLAFLVMILVVLVGCAQQSPATDETSAIQEKALPPTTAEAPVLSEEIPPGEPNSLETVSSSEGTGIVTQETAASRSACSRPFSPQFQAELYYTGPLFDAHFHLPPAFEDEQDVGWRMPILGKEITLKNILCFFEEEHVTGAFMFYMWDAEDLDGSIQDAAEMKDNLPSGIRLFLSPLEMEADELDEIVTANPGIFDGLGEITFYDPERPEATPDGPVSLEMYQLAGREGLIVMFHPGANQRAKVEKALQKNPLVKFLLHGYESEDYISELMDKYPNVYYSIDSATLYHFDGVFIFGPKAAFVSRFKKDFDTILSSKVNKWKPRIEKHPDRFMWGTDRATDWHFNEEISLLFEEFARAFIGRMNPEVQENYAYKNAESLLQ